MKTRLILLASVVVLAIAPALAQVSTSNITGVVQDSSGALIAGAKVVVTNEATGVAYEMQTNSSGAYGVSSVPPGSYSVTVSKEGFRTFSSTKNILQVGVPLVVNATLQVGAATETVQVESTYERLETTSAMISDVVSQKEVVALPLNGRNPLSLITLQSGLVQRPTRGVGSGTHVYGSRDRAHNVTIDGIDANESSVPNPQSNLYRLTPDNVQEFRVVTHSATAEFGRNSGANVAIATKSGTNEVHGDVYWFHRNTALNANEWFNAQAGKPKPVLLLNQYGGDAGGPIFKNKTFWFFSYQGNRIVQTQPISSAYGTASTYTASLRAGLFRYFVPDPANPFKSSSGSTITRNSPALVDPTTGALKVPLCATPTSVGCVRVYDINGQDITRGGPGIDPNIAKLFGSIPLPNDFTVGDGLNFGAVDWNPSSRFQGPNYMVRLDHKFNENNNIFGRVIWSDFDTLKGDFLNARPAVFPGFPAEGEVRRSTQSVAVSYRRAFSPSLVNEFTTGFSRFDFTFPLKEVAEAAKVTPLDYAQDCFGTSSFRNVAMPYCNTPHTKRAVSNIQFVDNLSFIRGSHTIRTGFNIRMYRHNDDRGVPGGFNMWPTIIFDRSIRNALDKSTFAAAMPSPSGINSSDNTNFLNAAAELLGVPARVQQVFVADLKADTYSFQLSKLHTRLRQYDFYAQDEWKVRNDLTINYGLRWEINPPGHDAGGATFVPNRAVDGSQGPVTFVHADGWWKNNNLGALAPRVGIAWAPGSGKTVVRAGGGIAFDTISSFQVTAMGGKVPGSVLQCRLDVQAAADPVCGDLPNDVRLSQLLAAGYTLKAPSVKPSSQFSPPAAPNGVAPNIGAFDPNLKTPTVYEWSLTVQRELPWRMVGQVGYVGKHGSHLYRAYDLNQVSVKPDFLANFFTGQQNMAICKANATACLNAQAAAGVSSASRTTDNFANWGLPGQAAMPLFSTLLGANTASGWRGSNATDMARNGAADIAVRIDQSALPASVGANYFRPNAQFSQIFYQDSGGNSHYHGLIVDLRRRFERGLELGFGYTFSKSIDDMSVDPTGASSGGGLSTTNSRTPTDIRNWRLDRSLSDFDNQHTIVAHFVYDLPLGRGRQWLKDAPGWLNHILGGWTVTGIYNYQSGEPFTVYSGVRTVNSQHTAFADLRGPKPSTDLQFLDDPTVRGPVVFRASGLDPATQCLTIVDTSSQFCIPKAGQHGNSGRNAFRGPSFWNFDSGVFKNFQLTERFTLQFRTEFFNVFNHPNFDNPRNASTGSPSLTSSVFGQTCCSTAALASSATVIATGEPNRVIQMGLKLSF